MLEGKIALVTGASRGIGRQIALTLGAKGAAVIVNYNGSAQKAEEVVKEIEAAGGRAEALQCNVSDFEACGQMMADIVARYGRLDILVNNAGITRDNLLMKMSEEDFDAVINTCLLYTSGKDCTGNRRQPWNWPSDSPDTGSKGRCGDCKL